MAEDLQAYSQHGNRSTIKTEDAILKLKVDRTIREGKCLESVLRETLSRDVIEELIPIATAQPSISKPTKTRRKSSFFDSESS